jgi:FkbM family methyltransferase
MFPQFNVTRPCRHGLMLFNPKDAYVGRSLDLYGEFSEGEVQLFAQLVRAGDVVVEVGSNIGALTIPLANLTGPTGRVFAFEPQRILFQTLCASVALNGITNVIARNEAVGAVAGVLPVPMLDYSHAANYGGLPLGPEADWANKENVPVEEVPVVTLDSVRLLRCRLLKIDVEGMEADVLAGAKETIARCRPLLYVENDRAEKAEKLVAAMKELGYVLHWHTPPLFLPDNHAKNAENVFGNILSFNVFGVPAEWGDMQLNGFTPVTEAVHPAIRR